MKDQVTSIEQSRRLLELGVPAEKASMVWEYWINHDFSKDVPEEVFYNLNTKTNREADSCDRDIPAFTVADLLGMLPPDIPAVGEQNHDYFLTLSNGFCWCLRYENSRMPHMYIGEKLEFDLIDLLCDRIEWLLSNGYKLND